MDRLIRDMSVAERISFLIDLAGVKLVERKFWKTGSQLDFNNTLERVQQMEIKYLYINKPEEE